MFIFSEDSRALVNLSVCVRDRAVCVYLPINLRVCFLSNKTTRGVNKSRETGRVRSCIGNYRLVNVLGNVSILRFGPATAYAGLVHDWWGGRVTF